MALTYDVQIDSQGFVYADRINFNRLFVILNSCQTFFDSNCNIKIDIRSRFNFVTATGVGWTAASEASRRVRDSNSI